jgi:hypothetical protein
VACSTVCIVALVATTMRRSRAVRTKNWSTKVPDTPAVSIKAAASTPQITATTGLVIFGAQSCGSDSITRIEPPSRNSSRVFDGTKRTIASTATARPAPTRKRQTILKSMKLRHCTTRAPLDRVCAKPCTSIDCVTGSR